MSAPITFGRPFVLRRDRDISDVSGTGIIADGVLFPDGHAAIHWRGKWPLTTPHPDGLESIVAIHDHGGRGDLHVIWPDMTTEGRKVLAEALGRAYALADRWEGAQGPSMSFVRAAGAELRDELDDAVACGDCLAGAHGPNHHRGEHVVAAAECSAQHRGFDDGPIHCIRAAQHRGDHVDEYGFHWSNTVAIYPVSDTREKTGEAATEATERTPRQRAVKAVDAYIESLGDTKPSTRSAHIAHIWLAVNRALEAAGHAADPEAQCRLPHEMEA